MTNYFTIYTIRKYPLHSYHNSRHQNWKSHRWKMNMSINWPFSRYESLWAKNLNQSQTKFKQYKLDWNFEIFVSQKCPRSRSSVSTLECFLDSSQFQLSIMCPKVAKWFAIFKFLKTPLSQKHKRKIFWQKLRP